jgi:hypothetical protein
MLATAYKVFFYITLVKLRTSLLLFFILLYITNLPIFTIYFIFFSFLLNKTFSKLVRKLLKQLLIGFAILYIVKNETYKKIINLTIKSVKPNL